MTEQQGTTRFVDTTTWSDLQSRQTLDLIAESALEMVGFRVACISIVMDGLLVAVSVAGDDAARSELLGSAYPVGTLQDELAAAHDWGRFRFLPHEQSDKAFAGPMWVPELAPVDVEDAWHPMDLLVAPLCDADGTWLGCMSVDVPVTGRRPAQRQRGLLERYAAQAERAVLLALERADLAEQIRLADAARALVQSAAALPSVEAALIETRRALLSGFGARGLWLVTRTPGSPTDQTGHLGDTGRAVDAEDTEIEMSPRLAQLAFGVATRLWADQRVGIIGVDGTTAGYLTDDERHESIAALRGLGLASMLFVPLGAAQECLGFLALTRAREDRPWSQTESSSALDIGSDLGSAVLRARAFERERHLVEELRQLDTYKSRLIATVSHELKTPLTAIVGHLELLDAGEPVPEEARASLEAMDRGARRLGRVVEGLLTLARVSDEARAVDALDDVDLVGVAAQVLDQAEARARDRGVEISLEVAPGPTTVRASEDEMGEMLAHLVANAVVYSHRGGAVVLSLASSTEGVTVSVVDEGIGIAAHEVARVFEEFYRSPAAAAAHERGTGLGLSIVERIVKRHGGAIALRSTEGAGTTVQVALPAV